MSKTPEKPDINGLSKNPVKILPPVNPYVILQETNDEEMESWYYFIKWNGNEENLKFLHDQLANVRWILYQDYSTFDLDIEHKVSDYTAKEMTKPDLNSCTFHRKFDGKLARIYFGFKKNDKNKRKIKKVFEHIGFGNIDNFIGEEDIDPEDLIDFSDEDSEEESSMSDDTDSSSSESCSDSPKENRKQRKQVLQKPANVNELVNKLKGTGISRKELVNRAKRQKKLSEPRE